MDFVPASRNILLKKTITNFPNEIHGIRKTNYIHVGGITLLQKRTVLRCFFFLSPLPKVKIALEPSVFFERNLSNHHKNMVFMNGFYCNAPRPSQIACDAQKDIFYFLRRSQNSFTFVKSRKNNAPSHFQSPVNKLINQTK